MIYVMGQGSVLEYGTHEELINAGGSYSRLVEAQKLRENDDTEGGSNVESETSTPKEMIPLERRNTEHSLSSQIVQKGSGGARKTEKNYSMIYLFSRMGRLARAQWQQYFIGSIFAISTTIFCTFSSHNTYDTLSGGNGLSSVRSCLCVWYQRFLTHYESRTTCCRRPNGSMVRMTYVRSNPFELFFSNHT